MRGGNVFTQGPYNSGGESKGLAAWLTAFEGGNTDCSPAHNKK